MKQIIKTVGLAIAFTFAVGAMSFLFISAAAEEVEARNKSVTSELQTMYHNDPDGFMDALISIYGEEELYENGFMKPKYADFFRTIVFEEGVQ